MILSIPKGSFIELSTFFNIRRMAYNLFSFTFYSKFSSISAFIYLQTANLSMKISGFRFVFPGHSIPVKTSQAILENRIEIGCF
jgi:hypothetical protein